ncbi:MULTISPECIES: sugar-binding transcriptional regulator [unclassified Luteococcus]|uniref:sugar-binding transcriptional regulator n=1 Tax=unclassified Luteococcus TaxID=2639923 RepID=UPI00313D9477
MLAEAKRRGIVQVRIVHPRARCHDLEAAMVDRFGLQSSIVVPGATQPEDNLRLVAGAAADALADLSPNPRVVAASWGFTMTALAEQISSMWTDRATVVQANGGLSHPGWGDPASVISRLARQSNGTPVFLPAPAVIDSQTLAPALRREPAIRGVLELARTADAIVFSLGAATRESVLVQSGCLTALQIDQLRRRGAVGDVLARFVNGEGEPVDEDLQARTIGLSLTDIHTIPSSIAVCAGPAKVAIARAALNQKLCTILVTDQPTASALLDR